MALTGDRFGRRGSARRCAGARVGPRGARVEAVLVCAVLLDLLGAARLRDLRFERERPDRGTPGRVVALHLRSPTPARVGCAGGCGMPGCPAQART